MSSSNTVSPSSIGHFGLRARPETFEAMVQWHLNFFSGRIVLQNKHAAFIAYDHEHHRLVIVQDEKHVAPADKRMAAGIYHIAFTIDSLAELAAKYEALKELGIEPHWPVNHGMSTSMYFFDPEGNELELQVNNFDTSEEALAFMATEEYAQNPIGVDIELEEWLRRVKSGEDEASLKKRPVIGQRLSRWENSIYFKEPPQ